jgi:hypothetical protein
VKKIEATQKPEASSPKPAEETSSQPFSGAPEGQAPPKKKEGNGHGRHIEHDVKPFDYTGDSPSPRVGEGRGEGEASGPQLVASLRLTMAVDPLSQQGSDMQSDAPACDVCGSITVRSGTCYKCLNCGNSMGCS